MGQFDFLLKGEDEVGIVPPIERVAKKRSPTLNTRESIFASAATAKLLGDMGDPEIAVSEDDDALALNLFSTGRTPTRYEQTLPGAMLKLEALLTEYDHHIIADADRIRTYVTNKLLEETGDKSATVRLKAYELLGKITEVGLFTEKREVSIVGQSTGELESVLSDKLDMLINGTFVSDDVIEVEPEDAPEDAAYDSAQHAAQNLSADDLLNSIKVQPKPTPKPKKKKPRVKR